MKPFPVMKQMVTLISNFYTVLSLMPKGKVLRVK